jgi:hypothetical protein
MAAVARRAIARFVPLDTSSTTLAAVGAMRQHL